MPPLLYIPCGSLDDEDVRSLVRLALSTDVSRVDTHGARRTALKYLLQMRSVDFDLSAHVNADQWPSLEKNFAQLSNVDLFKKEFALDNDDRFGRILGIDIGLASNSSLGQKGTTIHQRRADLRRDANQSLFQCASIEEHSPFSGHVLQRRASSMKIVERVFVRILSKHDTIEATFIRNEEELNK